MQLILVVGKVDMINQIFLMLSFRWKLLSACFAEKMIPSYITKYSTRNSSNAKCACIRNTNVFFHCMHVIQVGQHFNLHPNFELWKRRHYPIIPTGMRYIIKGCWQPGHQCESFHWSIIYTVVRGINARCWVICEAGMCEEQWTTGAAGVVIGCEPLKRN